MLAVIGKNQLSGTTINASNGSFHHLIKPHGKITPAVIVISAFRTHPSQLLKYFHIFMHAPKTLKIWRKNTFTGLGI